MLLSMQSMLSLSMQSMLSLSLVMSPSMSLVMSPSMSSRASKAPDRLKSVGQLGFVQTAAWCDVSATRRCECDAQM